VLEPPVPPLPGPTPPLPEDPPDALAALDELAVVVGPLVAPPEPPTLVVDSVADALDAAPLPRAS
jgi:hypothetical protein